MGFFLCLHSHSFLLFSLQFLSSLIFFAVYFLFFFSCLSFSSFISLFFSLFSCYFSLSLSFSSHLLSLKKITLIFIRDNFTNIISVIDILTNTFTLFNQSETISLTSSQFLIFLLSFTNTFAILHQIDARLLTHSHISIK